MFWAWSSPVLADKSAHILVVTASNEIPYQQATAGFKAQVAEAGKMKFTELSLAQARSSAKEVERLKPDLIYALGGDAAHWASLQTSRIPIIATMVLKDDAFRQSNMTGISLGYSLRTQFQWLKKFFPQQKAVAILYNPGENTTIVQDAKAASQQEGFTLVPIPVGSPKELPYALEQLANNVDVLLAIPDDTVMSVNTAKEVLLASFSNKVPLVGLSDNWVKSGALYALSWDYEDVGRQCGGIAQRILSGSPVDAIHPEHPRKITYTINAKVVGHMDLDIPASMFKNAKMVFN